MENRLIFWMSEKNKWALPPGALERPFGPICTPGGSVHLFFSLIRKIRRFYGIHSILILGSRGVVRAPLHEPFDYFNIFLLYLFLYYIYIWRPSQDFSDMKFI